MKMSNKFIIYKWMILTISLSTIVFRGPDLVFAEELHLAEGFYRTLVAERPFQPGLKWTADPNSWTHNFIRSGKVEYEKFSKGHLTSEDIIVRQYELGQKEKMRIELVDSNPLNRSPIIRSLETRPNIETFQPLLGIVWDYAAGNRGKWKVIVCLGVSFSEYHELNYAAETFGVEAQLADGGQIDIMDKIKNTNQIVGFEIRYVF